METKPLARAKVSASSPNDQRLLDLALRGDLAAWHELMESMRPIMVRPIRRVLRHRTRSGPADCEDILQHAFLVLIRRGPTMLLGWKEDGGRSVSGIFSLFAKRVALSWLKSGRRSGWAEHPVAPEQLEEVCGDLPASALEDRETLRRFWQALAGHLDDSKLRLFRAIALDEESVPQLCESFHLTPNAIYCARRRFRTLARSIQHQIETEPAGAPRRSLPPRRAG